MVIRRSSQIRRNDRFSDMNGRWGENRANIAYNWLVAFTVNKYYRSISSIYERNWEVGFQWTDFRSTWIVSVIFIDLYKYYRSILSLCRRNWEVEAGIARLWWQVDPYNSFDTIDYYYLLFYILHYCFINMLLLFYNFVIILLIWFFEINDRWAGQKVLSRST